MASYHFSIDVAKASVTQALRHAVTVEFDRVIRSTTVVNSSGGDSVVLSAATAIGGQRAVAVDSGGNAIHADAETATDVVGVSVGAVSSPGDPVTVRTLGELEDPAWGWTPGGIVYLGSGGVLTQTPPSSGFVVPIARAIGPTKIVIRIQPDIALAE